MCHRRPPPPPPPAPPQQYPQEIQLKLYQAFIFSIPILFSIILFLLFYLFYLKNRSTHLLPTTTNNATTTTTTTTTGCDWDLKKDDEVKNNDKLCRILFDENMEEEARRESMCSVCLGEYRAKEELVQVGKCKHVFHAHCLHLWLHSHSTCPLCRAPIHPRTNC